MRKSFKYILLIGIMRLLTSCVSDARFDDTGQGGDGLYLRMSLSIPEMQVNQTRGVLDDPGKNPETLTADYVEGLKFYMFIFENTGSPEGNYLRTLVHGDEITPLDNADTFAGIHDPDNQVLYSYKAKVDGTSEKAIIHLVATADPDFETQLQNATDRSELGLFYGASGLYTSGQYPAFWKRIDLDLPISEENKTKIEQKLSHVQMIRNFCRVTVKTNPSGELNGFQVLGYALVNQVDHGYVAAYSENEPRGFVEFEASNENSEGVQVLNGSMKQYADIYAIDKYIPSRHPLSVREHMEEDTADWLPADGEDDSALFTNSPKYMFERPYQSQHRTFVLIKGCFNNETGAPRYIKLDIGDIPEWYVDPEKGFLSSAFEYKHLYRNFSYDIVINNVAATEKDNVGAAKASAALSGAATNNIGASVETQSIKRINDGIDEMSVNRTKFVIVDDDEGNPNPEEFDLRWQYISGAYEGGPKTNDSGYVHYDDYPGMELISGDDSGIFDVVGPLKDFTVDGSLWKGVNIKFKKPGDVLRQKTVRLYYSNPSTNRPNVKLSRDITFVLRKRWEFVNKPVMGGDGVEKEYSLDVEVYPGAYSFDPNSTNPPYETLKEMREHFTPGVVGSGPGAELTVMFELPDDLPEAIFPLDFKIGANRQNIENAYVGNAPVISGPSLFEDQEHGDGSSTRLQYVKTVTWDYYNGSGDSGSKGHKLVCVRFLTTNYASTETGESGTGNTSVTRIRVKNDYFKSKGKKEGERIFGEGQFERVK